MNSDSIVDTTSNLVKDFYTKFLDLIPNLILAAIIFIIGLVMAWITRNLVRKFILYIDRNINKRLMSRSLGVDLKSISILISKTFYWVIIILTIAIVVFAWKMVDTYSKIPIYTASSDVLIEKSKATSGLEYQYFGYDPTFLSTQTNIITSEKA